MWFIRCDVPLPKPDSARMDAKLAAKVLAGGLTAMMGPIAAVTSHLTEQIIAEMLDDPAQKVPDDKVLTWARGRAKVFLTRDAASTFSWKRMPQEATGYDTREDAEAEAFGFVATRPWFMGHLEILKIKLGKPGA